MKYEGIPEDTPEIFFEMLKTVDDEIDHLVGYIKYLTESLAEKQAELSAARRKKAEYIERLNDREWEDLDDGNKDD